MERKVVTITAVTESLSLLDKRVVWLHMNRGDFYIQDAMLPTVPQAFWKIAQAHSALYPSEPALKRQEGNVIDFEEWVGKRVRIVLKESMFGLQIAYYEKPYSNYPKPFAF